jgi:hypothetical protein
MRALSFVSCAGRRARAVALGLALVALAGLPAAAAGDAPASPAPAMLGDRVLATFTGTIKGVVVLREGSGGAMGISVALVGTPPGTVRLVGSPDACSTPLPSAIRSFSLPFEPLRWVRTTVAGMMEEEGIWYYRSIRLVKPGSPNRQLACRNVRYLRLATAPTVAYQLENVLITSYAVAGGVRGMIVTGPGFTDPVPLVAVIQRRAPGATYRLVGSTAPCGTSHQANETVFDRTFPSSGVITRGITADDDWEDLTSFRVFRGSGFSQQARCIQNIQEFVEIV